MRTATTIAEKHDGTEVLIAGPKTPIQDQLIQFRDLASRVVHPDYASVRYQDSDGAPRIHRFISPEEHARREAERQASAGNPSEPATVKTQTQTPKSKNRMKKLVSAVAVLLMATFSLSAASWNDAFGIGGGAYGSPVFSGSGQTLSVVTSVRSNTVYYITSASAPGAPVFESIWIKPDLTGCVLDFWQPTNTLTVASNGTAGDTTVWLNASNTVGGAYTTLATNDLLVYRGANDVYQLVVLSGNATSSQGVVTSNALKQVQIKFFNGLTNAPAVGDTIYKLARIQQFTPLSFHDMTNSVLSPWGNFWPLESESALLRFSGVPGLPAVITLNGSNAPGLYVNGRYVRNP